MSDKLIEVAFDYAKYKVTLGEDEVDFVTGDVGGKFHLVFRNINGEAHLISLTKETE